MRCYICDKSLTDAEIQYIPETKKFDCCSVCLEIALDAAYSDGFQKEEALDDPDLQSSFGSGAEPVLDPGSLQTSFEFLPGGFQEARMNEL